MRINNHYKNQKMKKIVSLMLTAMIAAQCLMAQVPEGVKYLNYDKDKSAKDALQKAYAANPKDGQTIYWLGQALLSTDGTSPVTPQQIKEAKDLYQKSLNEIGSDPWLLVGMGHVELLEGGDLNSAKQKFEQAITASTETKGKSKGKPNVAILNAIGHSISELPSGKGDNAYAIDKLKQAAAVDPLTTPADVYINMGINYLKMGGENGGEAVKAYQEALNRDPKNALAYYRIGKIYQSQNNKDLFEQNFNNAITADPTFPPVYYAYYSYYAAKDVNKAKEYLDKYIANADKSIENDIFVADYLFRAGKNAESLSKLQELEKTTNATALPAINLLYAYNYDRSGDSVKAKQNLEQYFANPNAKINPEDYELAVKVFSKFPGSEATAVGYLEKAIANDTSKVNKLGYMDQAAKLYQQAKMYPQQLEWLEKRQALKGGPMDEFAYYSLTNTAFAAKDYPKAVEYAKAYQKAMPDKPQPYSFLKRSALAANVDSTNAFTLATLNYLDSIYATVDKEKYKKDIFLNQYYLITTYYQKKLVGLKNSPDFKITTDGQKTPAVEEYLKTAQEVVNITENMIAAYPDLADENNKWAQSVKADIQKRIDYYSKPPARKTGGSTAGAGTAGKGK
jgi:Tfp pilus assembly protein PilF